MLRVQGSSQRRSTTWSSRLRQSPPAPAITASETYEVSVGGTAAGGATAGLYDAVDYSGGTVVTTTTTAAADARSTGGARKP